ncbi:MAG TPA: NBR1-Ig-like domain-containing protein, partial [Anaerolineales bacterium]
MKTMKLLPSLLIIALLTACASSTPAAPTPTAVDVNALQTAAVKTVVASITGTAAAMPTQAPTETLTPAPVAPTETVTPTLGVTSTAALCDNSVFVNDASVPDGTQMTAGQSFVKTWKVKNTGTCAWKTSYQIIYAYGEKMGGVATNLTAEVLPNTEVEI